MQKRSRKGKKPDINELANQIVQDATDPQPEEEKPKPEDEGKDPLAVELGRRGGLKGGPARAKKLTKKQLSEAARRAALARWKKKRNQKNSDKK